MERPVSVGWASQRLAAPARAGGAQAGVSLRLLGMWHGRAFGGMAALNGARARARSCGRPRQHSPLGGASTGPPEGTLTRLPEGQGWLCTGTGAAQTLLALHILWGVFVLGIWEGRGVCVREQWTATDKINGQTARPARTVEPGAVHTVLRGMRACNDDRVRVGAAACGRVCRLAPEFRARARSRQASGRSWPTSSPRPSSTPPTPRSVRECCCARCPFIETASPVPLFFKEAQEEVRGPLRLQNYPSLVASGGLAHFCRNRVSHRHLSETGLAPSGVPCPSTL